MSRNLNYRMILRLIGGLLTLESVFMLVPLITSAIYHESDWIPFGIIAFITALCGCLFFRINVESNRFTHRESYIFTSSVWIILSLFGMLPFMFCSTPINISDAFFEAMSGFTTTGATTRPADAMPFSHGIQMWQALMQWLGGMGIILFTIAIIPALNNTGGMQMFNAEVTGITHDKIGPRISETAKKLWGIYSTLTVLLILLLWIGPMNLFESIVHAFGTISTGGFSTRAGSIAEFNSDYTTMITIIFMILGGLNFAIIYKAIHGRWTQVRSNNVVRAYFGAIATFTILFIASIIINGQIHSWEDVSITPLFQVVSTITSTGYIAPTFMSWGPFVLALTFIMMLSGGCAGSTSGGAKIDRLLVLKRYLANEIRHAVRPNGVFAVRINGAYVSNEIVSKVVAFLCLFMMLIVGGGAILSMMGLAPVDAFFSAFSCISNTGFGASVTGYGENFAIIPNAAKWVLAALMLIGRLEIFTVLVIFSRCFWRR